MREAYRVAWSALALIGRPWVAWGGGLAFVALYAAAYGQPMNALPLLLLWALFVASCWLLVRMLPVPRAADLVRKSVPPPPQLAVDVAPVLPADAPVPLEVMVSRLPASLRKLLRETD